MTEERDNNKDARDLLRGAAYAMLSTHSQDVPGYPFGSVVPLGFDACGQPMLLISRLAQHTKNLSADPHASLMVVEEGEGDVQSRARLTLLGKILPLEADDRQARERYLRLYPEAKEYLQLDFDFYRLHCEKVRYIGGFGRIHWVSKDSLWDQPPLPVDDEISAVEHMNSDHADAVRHYADLLGMTVPEDEAPQLVAIDREGCVVRVADRLGRLLFARTVADMTELRREMVSLARRPASTVV